MDNHKNYGILISSAISLAAVVVSFSQVWIAHIDKRKELEVSRTQIEITTIQGKQQLNLKELELERRWKLEAVKFTTKNMGLIFSKNEEERIRIRNVMLATFPLEITEPLFKKLESSVPLEDKEVWRKGNETIVNLNKSNWEGKWLDTFNGTGGLTQGILTLSVSKDFSVAGTSTYTVKEREVTSEIKGTLSKDTFRIDGTWKNTMGEEGRLTFKIHDSGNTFSGFYSASLNKSADSNPFNTWNGRKITDITSD